MDIYRVAEIIKSYAEGFEAACFRCLANHSGVVVLAVQEQLYSGVDSQGQPLSPTYDDDPYFNEPGYWHGRGADYKAWKRHITPPSSGPLLGLPPRRDEVPNLFIDGTFFSEITAEPRGDTLVTDPGIGNGPEIVSKYGDRILALGSEAVGYFNREYMLPAIEKHLKDSGYR